MDINSIVNNPAFAVPVALYLLAMAVGLGFTYLNQNASEEAKRIAEKAVSESKIGVIANFLTLVLWMWALAHSWSSAVAAFAVCTAVHQAIKAKLQ